jgi:class 3 adenylate cyclase
MTQQSQRMLVISFDLCRYAEITVAQNATAGDKQNPMVVTNAAIHKAIVDPLKEIARGSARLRYYIKSTGDGALVFFPVEHARVAIDYVLQFQARAERENRKRLNAQESIEQFDDNAFRFYRAGCAVGNITVYVVSKHAGADFAGVAIADSVRIESNGRAGETLISNDIYALLDKPRKKKFGRRRKIFGKHGSEKYIVRTKKPKLIAPWEIRAARKHRWIGFWQWGISVLIPLLIYEFRVPLGNLLLSLP